MGEWDRNPLALTRVEPVPPIWTEAMSAVNLLQVACIFTRSNGEIYCHAKDVDTEVNLLGATLVAAHFVLIRVLRHSR